MKYSLTLNFETKEELEAFLSGPKDAVATTVKEVPAEEPKAAPKAKAVKKVVEAPPAEEPHKLFDRAEVLAKITKTMKDLTDCGVPSTTIAATCSTIFGQLGIPVKKIGELLDNQLYDFNALFIPEVARIRDAMEPKQNHFI